MFANSIDSITKKFRDRRYRDAFVASGVRNWIAYQIRALRNQRGWSQTEFADKIGKKQSVISRIENPEYGKLTVQTLLEIAKTFNVALVIKFVDFSSFLRQTEDASTRAMEVEEYNETKLRDQALSFTHIEPTASIGRRFILDQHFGVGYTESYDYVPSEILSPKITAHGETGGSYAS